MDYTIIAFLLGRIIFGGYFLMSGWNHFKHLEGTSQYAAAKGIPMPKLAVIVSGLLLLFGGMGVLLGLYAREALLLLVLFFIPITFKMHDFWTIDDPTQKMIQQINFTKNMALLGAILILYFLWP